MCARARVRLGGSTRARTTAAAGARGHDSRDQGAGLGRRMHACAAATGTLSSTLARLAAQRTAPAAVRCWRQRFACAGLSGAHSAVRVGAVSLRSDWACSRPTGAALLPHFYMQGLMAHRLLLQLRCGSCITEAVQRLLQQAHKLGPVDEALRPDPVCSHLALRVRMALQGRQSSPLWAAGQPRCCNAQAPTRLVVIRWLFIP